jgi:hypothetical protein
MTASMDKDEDDNRVKPHGCCCVVFAFDDSNCADGGDK